MKLFELCREYTGLSDDDIAVLEEVARHNRDYALLSGCDVFIDCIIDNPNDEKLFADGEELAVVISHARPVSSRYPSDISGYIVHSTIEPIVFRVARLGIPMRDDKVITMEGEIVHQRATPITNSTGRMIGILIQESDITEVIETGRKLENLVKSTQRLAGMNDGYIISAIPERDIILRETHHRIKNNLQVIYSIISMQSRRSQHEDTRRMLEDDLNVINCIAMMHETLSARDDEQVDMNLLVNKLIAYFDSILRVREKEVHISLTGDQLYLDSGRASSAMLIINELLTNSINHAFNGEREDESPCSVVITFSSGNSYKIISVADNGCGFDAESEDTRHLGLELISQIAQLELKSELMIDSEPGKGTVSTFTFK